MLIPASGDSVPLWQYIIVFLFNSNSFLAVSVVFLVEVNNIDQPVLLQCFVNANSDLFHFYSVHKAKAGRRFSFLGQEHGCDHSTADIRQSRSYTLLFFYFYFL